MRLGAMHFAHTSSDLESLKLDIEGKGKITNKHMNAAESQCKKNKNKYPLRCSRWLHCQVKSPDLIV